jgi:uncharacterized membrane protein YbhN (UPF0104 family)
MNTTRSRQPAFLRWLKHLAGLALVVWLIWYLASRWHQMQAVVHVSWGHLLGTALGVLLTWTLMSLQGQILLRALGARLGFFEHLLLMLSSILVNYLPVRLGPVLRFHYLRSRHSLPMAHFGSLLGLRAILLVGSCGFAGLVAAILQRARGTAPPDAKLLWIFGGLCLAALAALWLPLPQWQGDHRLARLWTDLLEGVQMIRSRPALVLQVLALMFGQILLVAGRFAFTYDSVQLQLPAEVLVQVAALAAIVNLLALTMGSLGLREAVIGFATEAAGFDFAGGLFAGVVDRVVLMALAYSLGAVGLLYVWRRLRNGGDGSTPAG